jgi:membrane protein
MVYWTVLTLGPLVLGGGLLSWRWLLKFTRLKNHAAAGWYC